jgi:hypothetical protein
MQRTSGEANRRKRTEPTGKIWTYAALGRHSLVLENGPKIRGPEQRGDVHGDELRGTYHLDCRALDQSRISGRAGGSVSGSGAGPRSIYGGNVRLPPPKEEDRTCLVVIIMIRFTWSSPKRWLATLQTLVPTSPLRILNSLQAFVVCRRIVITLVRSRGHSKQCRQSSTVPSLPNYLG